MQLSDRGTKMLELTGIRSVMVDIAEAAAGAAGWVNLSPGNPAVIPEVGAVWQRHYERALGWGVAQWSGAYGPSRGLPDLVTAVVEYFNGHYGWGIGPENVVVGPGCQQLAFAATTIFTGRTGRTRRPLVLPSVPDYTGYLGLSLDRGGIVGVPPRIVPEGGRDFRYAADVTGLDAIEDMGMLLVSSPANPSGRSLEAGELRGLAEAAARRDVPLFVDNAYGNPFPSIVRTGADPLWHPHVVNMFTLSKAGLPGERLGIAVGPPEPIAALVAFQANTVLHTAALVQAVAASGLASGDVDRLASDVIGPYYRERRLAAEKQIHEMLPDDLAWRMHVSDGGLFCWLWLDEPWFDDAALYAALRRKKVFVVPGHHFFTGPLPQDHHRRCFRISLTVDDATLAEGLHRIARTLGEMRRAG